MKLDLKNVDWDELKDIAFKELKKGGKELLDELKNDEDKKIVEETMQTLTKEYLKMLQAETPEEEEYHKRNIEICRGTLESFEAAVALKCYYRTLDIIGVAIGVVVVAALKSMI